MEKTSKLKVKRFKNIIYVVLAALLCFIGPTYFVAVMSNIISQIYAIVLGLCCFFIGIVFIFKLVEE
ncbi:MAG: hypothetical protein JSV05_06655 [Candidatus Bathyarchaeota archaeon]|nr:MAG: hypothetical protein JSV05_06655 [Candidatus Bathyarchaeota archaeon]